jgi:Zn-dependent protease with chaperone function
MNKAEAPPFQGGQKMDAVAFGPGFRPEGEPIQVEVGADGIHFIGADQREYHVAFEQIRLHGGGLNNEKIFLSWDTYSLALTDPRPLFQSPPEPLVAQIRQFQQQHTRQRQRTHIGWSGLGLIFLIPVLILLLFLFKSEGVVDWMVDRISIASEVALGEQIYAQMEGGLKPAPQFEGMVREIGEKLTAGTPYRFQWHVVEDAQVNAFAVPGGHVVVFTGLLQAADSAEEVAGVLAHEVQHVLKRHSLKGIAHSLGLRALLSFFLGSGAGGDFAAQMGSLKFGRGQESEADLEGLLLLKKAKIKPEGMVSFFSKLAQKEGTGIALLSSHPASDDRAEALSSAIAQMGRWRGTPLPYDWKQVHASLSPSP